MYDKISNIVMRPVISVLNSLPGIETDKITNIKYWNLQDIWRVLFGAFIKLRNFLFQIYINFVNGLNQRTENRYW